PSQLARVAQLAYSYKAPDDLDRANRSHRIGAVRRVRVTATSTSQTRIPPCGQHNHLKSLIWGKSGIYETDFAAPFPRLHTSGFKSEFGLPPATWRTSPGWAVPRP